MLYLKFLEVGWRIMFCFVYILYSRVELQRVS